MGDTSDTFCNILSAVGKGSGAESPRVAVVDHEQKDLSIVSSFLTFQQFQGPSVAEGLHIVAYTVKNIMHERVAPVKGAENSPDNALQCILVFQMKKFMKYDFFIGDCSCRKYQYRFYDSADEGRRKPLYFHCRAGLEPVFITNIVY